MEMNISFDSDLECMDAFGGRFGRAFPGSEDALMDFMSSVFLTMSVEKQEIFIEVVQRIFEINKKARG